MDRVLCTVPVGNLDENGHQGEDLKKERTCQSQAKTSWKQQGERILAFGSGRKPCQMSQHRERETVAQYWAERESL